MVQMLKLTFEGFKGGGLKLFFSKKNYKFSPLRGLKMKDERCVMGLLQSWKSYTCKWKGWCMLGQVSCVCSENYL